TKLSPAHLAHYVKRLEAHLAAPPHPGLPLPGSPSGGRAAAPPDHYLPVPAQDRKTTPEQSSGGMEVVGEVGENPPTSPPPREDGGSALTVNCGRLEGQRTSQRS